MAPGRHEVADVGDDDLRVIRRRDFEHMRRLMKHSGCITVG